MPSNLRIYVYNGENTERLDGESVEILHRLTINAFCDIQADLEERDVELSTASCISLSREMEKIRYLARLFLNEEEDNDSEQA